MGQLGHGDEMVQRMKPRVVADLPMCVSAVAGGMHTVCLTKDGEVCINGNYLLMEITFHTFSAYEPARLTCPESVMHKTERTSHSGSGIVAKKELHLSQASV